MISHKCYSNPHVLMTRSKASKNSSRSFQVSSEISFLISVRKASRHLVKLLTWHPNFFLFGTKRYSWTSLGQLTLLIPAEPVTLSWADLRLQVLIILANSLNEGFLISASSTHPPLVTYGICQFWLLTYAPYFLVSFASQKARTRTCSNNNILHRIYWSKNNAKNDIHISVVSVLMHLAIR